MRKEPISSKLNDMDYGKLPPQAKDLEEAVLGALMSEDTAINEVSDFLTDHMFYVDAHQRIYKAITQLHAQNKPLDLLMVTDQLKKTGDLDAAGGYWFVSQLPNKVGSAANIQEHARIVFEQYIKRQVISISTDAIKAGYDDSSDPMDLLDQAVKDLEAVQKSILNGQIEGLSDQVDEAVQKLQEQSSVPSKHDAINANFGGWQRGNMYVIAARPGMGKSAHHVSEIIYALQQGYKCASFNPEMTKRQFVMRLIANISEVSNKQIKEIIAQKNIHLRDHEEFSNAVRSIKELPLTMDFTGGITVDHVIAKCKKLKLERGLDIAFIDYLQLITLSPADARGINRDQYIGIITRKLKAMAKNLDLSVILYCQLNRQTETKADKRPVLADLRESGNIENDCDGVLFLLRPEYYFKRDHEGHIIYENADQEGFKNICQAICAKNREDTTFEVEWNCYLGISKFKD